MLIALMCGRGWATLRRSFPALLLACAGCGSHGAADAGAASSGASGGPSSTGGTTGATSSGGVSPGPHTWEATAGRPPGYSGSLSIDIDGTMYVGSNLGVFVSGNFGETWTEANGTAPDAIQCVNISASNVKVDTSSHYVYATNACPSGPPMWYRSTDRGASWTPVAGFDATSRGEGIAVSKNLVGGVHVVCAGHRWGGPNGGPYCSTDNGATASVPAMHPIDPTNGAAETVAGMGTNSVTGAMYAGTEDSAVWSSADNGLSWQKFAVIMDDINGVPLGNVSALGNNRCGVPFAGWQKALSYLDPGATVWKDVTTVPQYQQGSAIAMDSQGVMYYATVNPAKGTTLLSRSTDDGHTFAEWDDGLPAANGTNAVGSWSGGGIEVNPCDGRLYAVDGTGGVYRTTDPVQPATCGAVPPLPPPCM
jgi:hypothetical protein